MRKRLIPRNVAKMRSIFLQAGQEIQTRKIALGFFIISVFYIIGSFAIGWFVQAQVSVPFLVA